MKNIGSTTVAAALLAAAAAIPLACIERTPVGSNTPPTVSTPSSSADARPAQPGGELCGTSPPPSPAPGCPAAAPGEMACSTRGLICDYPRGDGWTSCTCVAGTRGETWRCYGVSAMYDCPLVRPDHGSACGKDDFGRSCHFLRAPACTCEADKSAAWRRDIVCDCKRETQQWQCANQGAGGSTGTGGPFDEAACYGSGMTLPQRPGLDGDRTITSLDDTELASFCDWYQDLNYAGGPPPPRTPQIDGAGNAVNYGFVSCGTPVFGCAPALSADLCKASLRRSGCGARLRDLEDCLLTFRNQCDVIGDGCQALYQQPACRTALVRLDLDSAPGTPTMACPVPVR